MSIDEREANELSKLCKLEFSKCELIKITNQINKILEEVKKIEMLEESVDTCNKADVNIFKKDAPKPSLAQGEVFLNTKNKRGDYFVHKKDS